MNPLVVMFIFTCSPADPDFCHIKAHAEESERDCQIRVDTMDRRPKPGYITSWCEDRDEVPGGQWEGSRKEGDALLRAYFD